MSEVTTPKTPRKKAPAKEPQTNASATQALMLTQNSTLPIQRHNDLYQRLVAEFVMPKINSLGIQKAMETLNTGDLEQLYVLSHIATSVFESSAAKAQTEG